MAIKTRSREARKLAREDRELVRRMIAGEESAFEAFSEGYIPPLYRFAQRRLGGDRELTRDIVQTTLCKAIAKLASFRGEAGLMTWLCACCRNEIAGHYRRAGRPIREVELGADDEALDLAPESSIPMGPDGDLLRKEEAHLVHVALDALPPHYGRALEWKYLEELPVREIASRLNLGLKAAESLLTRARQAFRERYVRVAAGATAGTRDLGTLESRTAMQ